MTTIEPTQEQRDAAWVFINNENLHLMLIEPLVRFLAEREAKVAEVWISKADADWQARGGFIEALTRALARERRTYANAQLTKLLDDVVDRCIVLERADVALDALTKRNAALLADKDDLSRQLRRVEEDRDAAHARAQKAEHALAQRDMVLATVKECWPRAFDHTDAFKADRDSRDRAIAQERVCAALDGCVLMVVSAGTYAQREKERDAAIARAEKAEADAFRVSQLDCANIIKIRDLTAEVAALKAKLAEVEADRDRLLPAIREARRALDSEEPDNVTVEALISIDLALSSVGAGTEWAAPIAAAGKPARDPVLPTVRAATSPLDWQDDEKGGAK